MTATTWTADDIAALEASIKTGQTTVRYGDREVVYGSIPDMIKLLGLMRATVDAPTTPSVVYAGRVCG